MLKEIQCFCMVVQEHSLAGAARKLGVSTPMMTRHIQHLEQELGAKLLHRTTRDMSLTESGAVFYEQALDILTSYEAGKRAIETKSSDVSGTLKIALPASIAAGYVVPRLHELHAHYPQLQINIVQGNHMLDMIHQGFDCVLHCGRMPSSSFFYKKIAEWKKYTCMSPDLLKKIKKITKPQDLQEQNCLLHTNNKNQTWSFVQKNTGKLIDLYMNACFKADSSMLLADMAAQGLGVAYLPSFTVQSCLRRGQLVSVLDDWMPDPLDIYVVYPDKKYLNKKLQILIQFLIEVIPGVTEVR